MANKALATRQKMRLRVEPSQRPGQARAPALPPKRMATKPASVAPVNKGKTPSR